MSIQSNRWSRSRNCISAPIYVWIIYIEGRKTVTFPIFLHFYNWIKKNIISKYKWKISFFPFIIILQLLNYCIYFIWYIKKGLVRVSRYFFEYVDWFPLESWWNRLSYLSRTKLSFWWIEPICFFFYLWNRTSYTA